MSILENIRSRPAPYVVTVLLGVCGWCVSYAIDNLSKAPIVEYSVELKADDRVEGKNVVSVEWRNLSYEKQFGEMTFVVAAPGTDSGEFRYRPLVDRFDCVAPAFKFGTAPDTRIPSSARFGFEKLQPGAHCRASVAYSGDETPIIFLTDSEDTVTLLKRSLVTWLIRNRIQIIIGVALGTVVLALALLGTSFRDAPSSHETDSCSCSETTGSGGNKDSEGGGNE